jgi:hypothetical protein
MTQMLAQREHDYFAETVICANCYIVAFIIARLLRMCCGMMEMSGYDF